MPSHDTKTENSDFIDVLNVELRKIEDQITSLNSELEIVHGELERVRQRGFIHGKQTLFARLPVEPIFRQSRAYGEPVFIAWTLNSVASEWASTDREAPL